MKMATGEIVNKVHWKCPNCKCENEERVIIFKKIEQKAEMFCWKCQEVVIVTWENEE